MPMRCLCAFHKLRTFSAAFDICSPYALSAPCRYLYVFFIARADANMRCHALPDVLLLPIVGVPLRMPLICSRHSAQFPFAFRVRCRLARGRGSAAYRFKLCVSSRFAFPCRRPFTVISRRMTGRRSPMIRHIRATLQPWRLILCFHYERGFRHLLSTLLFVIDADTNAYMSSPPGAIYDVCNFDATFAAR